MTTDPFEDRDQFLQETIDRLRAEVRQINAHTAACSVDLFHMTQRAEKAEAELDRLRAENERLKNDWEEMHTQENWIIKKGEEECDRLRAEKADIEAATIEQCAEVLDRAAKALGNPAMADFAEDMADAIRALAKANETEGK